MPMRLVKCECNLDRIWGPTVCLPWLEAYYANVGFTFDADCVVSSKRRVQHCTVEGCGAVRCKSASSGYVWSLAQTLMVEIAFSFFGWEDLHSLKLGEKEMMMKSERLGSELISSSFKVSMLDDQLLRSTVQKPCLLLHTLYCTVLYLTHDLDSSQYSTVQYHTVSLY